MTAIDYMELLNQPSHEFYDKFEYFSISNQIIQYYSRFFFYHNLKQEKAK